MKTTIAALVKTFEMHARRYPCRGGAVLLSPVLRYSLASVKLGLISELNMLSWWFLGAFGALYTLSIITFSRVQHRWISRCGWRVFNQRSLKELYWDELTRTERWLVYPGIVVFLLMLVTLASWSLFVKIFR